MNRTDFISHLLDLDACAEALTWIEKTPGEPADLWAACPRSDWLIWLLAEVAYDERVMRHIACDCAEDALPIYERHRPDDRRPRDCIAVARRYADGEATEEERAAAWAAAWAAADAAARAAAEDAAEDAAAAASWAASWAAVWAAAMAAAADAARAASRDAAGAAAADAAWDAARAAAGAAAADAAWDAARAAAEDAAWDAARARQADVVRARVSWADVERVMERTARAAEGQGEAPAATAPEGRERVTMTIDVDALNAAPAVQCIRCNAPCSECATPPTEREE